MNGLLLYILEIQNLILTVIVEIMYITETFILYGTWHRVVIDRCVFTVLNYVQVICCPRTCNVVAY